MEPFKMLPLFLLLSFAASAKALENPWSPDEFKVSCPTENIMCNVHLSHQFQCFCHVNRPASNNVSDFQWFENYNTCDDLFEVGPKPEFGVFEAQIDLKLYPTKINSWVDFDNEFSQWMSRVTNTNQNQILILRKFCRRGYLIVQFVFLKQKALDNWHGDKLRLDNVTTNVYIDNYLMKKIPVVRRVNLAYDMPNQSSLKYYAKNFCENEAQIPLPTVCNTHDPKLTCICGFNTTGNGTGPFNDLPFCDTLGFQKETAKVFTFVFIRNLDTSMAEIEQLVLNDLADMMDAPRGSYVILRKFCRNGYFHVQTGRLAPRKIRKLPSYNEDDLIDAGLSSAHLKHVIPYVHAGNLHKKSMEELILLQRLDFDEMSRFEEEAVFMKGLFTIFLTKDFMITGIMGMIGLVQFIMYQNAIAIEKATEKYEKFLEREFGDVIENLIDAESDVEDDKKGAGVHFIDENDDADDVLVVHK
uniref:Uncharacterized protein n=1 Tax=Panagrellus redivivus TaxID=6233 RepID=A0A7E4VBM3_PANRE